MAASPAVSVMTRKLTGKVNAIRRAARLAAGLYAPAEDAGEHLDGLALVVGAPEDGELARGQASDGAAHHVIALVDLRVARRQQRDAQPGGDGLEGLLRRLSFGGDPRRRLALLGRQPELPQCARARGQGDERLVRQVIQCYRLPPG